jgi:hypothetical protein
MAYNRKNFLRKVLKIQEIVLHHSKQGLFLKEIYHLHVEHQFNICKRTYDSYLGINARKELKELIEKQNNDQLTLF